ncbi:four helix bundle protein [candidate division TA06 bacterium]|uniref:Four helix bundle protein n=1 Tax=candidate division TA06 bacterium TaxID=2250710 RepID=A0A933I9M7_UNCT6|nr:four helix bundle protein [candidate division TA06 bacterium]
MDENDNTSSVRKPIQGFRDLEVFQITYAASSEIHTVIVPRLPREERYDLASQLRRSSKAGPRLIAEGYSKRHQKRGFQKYLDDALAESNETIVSLSQVKDLYGNLVDNDAIERLLATYDRASRQIYRLAQSWKNFTER